LYSSSSSLRLVYQEEAVWKSTVLDSSAYTTDTHYPSLDIDANGYLHVSYRDSSPSRLTYGTNKGGAWQFKRLDNTNSNGVDSALAVDSGGHVHIAYCYSYSADLKYLTW
jgi:hypothetical protein